jgi:succinoglycan biosynthesis transport protein ExoP
MKDLSTPSPRPPGTAAPSRDDDLIRVGAILAAIARGSWIMALTIVACVVLAWHYAVNVATPIYRATATIVLETDDRSFIDFDETTGQLSRDNVSLNTEVGVLRGVDMMGRVVDALALHLDPEFAAAPGNDAATTGARDAAMRALLQAVEVRNLPESLIFEVAVTTSDPVKSVTIANTIAETYIAEQVERKIAETQRAADWLRDRVAELQVDLLAAEIEVEGFRFGRDGENTDDIARREQLATEAEAIRTLYRYLLSRLQETVAQEGLQRPDSRILSLAMLPPAPFAPRLDRLLLVGAAAGVFLGLVGIFLREAARTGIRTRKDLVKLTGLPVLAEVPRVPVSRWRSGIRGLAGPGAVAHAEAIENLLTKLAISHAGEAARVYAIVSPDRGDGKTSTVLSMARQVARRGQRALVIDTDTRMRTLSRNTRFGGDGLIAVLEGSALLAEAAQANDILGCDVLGLAGTPGAASARLRTPRTCAITSQRTRRSGSVAWWTTRNSG